MIIQAFVPSVRPELLRKLLESWWQYGRHPLHVHAQREPRAAWAPLEREFGGLPLSWSFAEHGGPIYPMRVRCMLQRPDVDLWIHLDDDMQLLPETNWDAAIEKAQQVGVGVVSCNWVRSEHPNLIKRAWPPGDQLWVKQPIVNMAGGMIYGRHVLAAMAEHAETPFLFDDVQVGLCAYLAGYENWRYRGSLLIHRILAPGGYKTVCDSHVHALPDPRWITVKRCTPVCKIDAHNVYMPSSASVTEAAHEQHRMARTLLVRPELGVL